MKEEKKDKLLQKLKTNLKKYINFFDKKNKFNMMEVVALMIITVIFGMFLGGILMYKKGSLNTGIKKELNEFVNTYTEILNEYYEDVSSEGLLEAGISGMVDYLGDPYSTYMDEETSTAFNEQVSGKYVGIGTTIGEYMDGSIKIQEVNKDGPAYKAGLREGDTLIKVDGKDITDKKLNDISSLVKGKVGTTVSLTVKRDDEELTFKVKRENIDLESVSKKLIEYKDKKIGYLLIDIFALNTASQFEERLKELEKEKIDSLIIDVRGNSGGYLSTVTDIISLFLPKGKVIYQLKTKDEIEKIIDKTSDKRDYKVAMLVNGGSASASEVLTAALMEQDDAIVVGTITYGKGKVQKTQELSNGASIKFTFQEWLTPKGNSIDEKGIKPDYEVVYEASEDENGYDTQLQKALDLLVEGE